MPGPGEAGGALLAFSTAALEPSASVHVSLSLIREQLLEGDFTINMRLLQVSLALAAPCQPGLGQERAAGLYGCRPLAACWPRVWCGLELRTRPPSHTLSVSWLTWVSGARRVAEVVRAQTWETGHGG